MELTKIKEILKEKLPLTNIKYEEPMKMHTSFKVGGVADVFITANNLEEVIEVVNISKENNIPLKIVGNGTNLLVKDKGFRGIILKTNLQEINISKDEKEENKYIINVQSGVALGKLAQVLLKNEIGGFEFASGIPGTIGGAIKMNAGAYGGEFKDIVQNVTYLDDKNNIIKLLNNQCDFSYRHSFFSDKNYIILGCEIVLHKDKKENIQKKLEDNLNSRKEKQPIEYPSAGSTFKRGENYITAKLIDECGLKGYQIGGAQVSEKHAGFIINKDNATAEDIINLIEYVKKAVYEKTGEKIKLEIEIIGE
jgi:UDP-N-acetylmuramate dehydrogenase